MSQWTITDKPNTDAQQQAAGGPITGATSVAVKRQVRVKTIVTHDFRTRAKSELSKEVEQIDHQMEQLETAFNNSLQQLEAIASEGQNVLQARAQLEQDAMAKRNQLVALKQEVSKQLGNLDGVADGQQVITGMLESMVDLQVGDNIYDRVRNTEVVVKDGVIVEFIHA